MLLHGAAKDAPSVLEGFPDITLLTPGPGLFNSDSEYSVPRVPQDVFVFCFPFHWTCESIFWNRIKNKK